MQTNSKFIAASFGLLIMALPSIASANVGLWHPADVQPTVLQETAAPLPHLPLATIIAHGHAAIGDTVIIIHTDAANSVA
jgi:hypothetical protein